MQFESKWKGVEENAQQQESRLTFVVMFWYGTCAKKGKRGAVNQFEVFGTIPYTCAIEKGLGSLEGTKWYL